MWNNCQSQQHLKQKEVCLNYDKKDLLVVMIPALCRQKNGAENIEGFIRYWNSRSLFGNNTLLVISIIHMLLRYCEIYQEVVSSSSNFSPCTQTTPTLLYWGGRICEQNCFTVLFNIQLLSIQSCWGLFVHQKECHKNLVFPQLLVW